MSNTPSSIRQHTVVIIGAGTGGAAVAARLRRNQSDLDIAVIEPSSHHDYQPAWTLVGGGAYRAEDTRRNLHDCLPDGVRHIAQRVARLLPDERLVELDDGGRVAYDYLVVAAGIQINWDAIDGLAESLGKNGVTSNYRYDLAPYTWELVRQFQGGTAIFTQPAGAVKCPGAPQKALYLAADHFRRQGVKPASLQFRSGGASVFGIPFYAQALDKVMASYGAEPHYSQTLVQVRGEDRIAVFESVVDGQAVREEVAYDILHVVPPQGAPDFIRQSPLADASGWLEVDKHTLRHPRYPNVFGLGDCTSTPNSKTAAAIKSQAPVLVSNLLGALRGAGNVESYDGYAACPLTTSRGKVLLAEFTYGGTIAPSLPLDPRVPRRFYWWLKRSFLPWFYWNILIKGRGLPVTHKSRTFPAGAPSVQP
ncbi:FAD/NAD(P)-binding oxidoreductase [uncultured Castellaniella sp.]|uniref:NAD(P)/FAD-dependent oxidoreductase n=1 Tax=uncultured Castellaniella sp. TaxID=647907 RepID=UPI00262A20B7|nr:FAD/NAD(P)-binding oxidoreductase [uncultured Castellaniella sp.]